MPSRMWYVEGYLKPSMIEQGIAEKDIRIYNDVGHEGNLRACMSAFASVEGDGGTWHLQDDVCICKDFKERTEKYDSGIVCGFSSEMYDGSGNVGIVDTKNMWFSFPCIRIPNDYTRDCSKWVLKYIIDNPVYRGFWISGVNDDWMFKQYIKTYHLNDEVLNLAPNLVNHIDYLIGGSSGGKKRDKICVSQYWDDDDIVNELKERLRR